MRNWGWPTAYWAATALAVVAVLLIAANAVLLSRDQDLQAEVNQRQQIINQGVRLSQLNTNLIRALAGAAVTERDDKLRDILAEVGVTFTVNAGGAPASAKP